MDKHIFIDEQGNIIQGKKAKIRLEKTSDAAFLNGKGISAIPKERWAVAQSYEKHTWTVTAAHSTEDRNYDHYLNFDGYKTLNGMRFDHAIELGCGPFTNLRYIMRACEIKKCTLLDPLIESHLHHRNCTYTKTYLRGEEKPLYRRLSSSFFLRMMRRLLKYVAPEYLFSTLPVNEIISKPIEEMPAHSRYDLAVLINVIEHCYHIDLIFNNIKKILKRDAIFIIHDKYYAHSDIAREAHKKYDAGHPLRVDMTVLDNFLDENFTCLYKKVARKEEIVDELDFSHDVFYFIGKYRQ